MSKYIDADKLITLIDTKLEDLGLSGSVWVGRSVLQELKDDIITSLQQEQPIQVNTLTWKDINDLERIINNVHYEFRNGIGEKSFGEEVLERFMEERDEQEQPEVDLEKEIDKEWNPRFSIGWGENSCLTMNRAGFEHFARHFYELGLNARNKK